MKIISIAIPPLWTFEGVQLAKYGYSFDHYGDNIIIDLREKSLRSALFCSYDESSLMDFITLVQFVASMINVPATHVYVVTTICQKLDGYLCVSLGFNDLLCHAQHVLKTLKLESCVEAQILQETIYQEYLNVNAFAPVEEHDVSNLATLLQSVVAYSSPEKSRLFE